MTSAAASSSAATVTASGTGPVGVGLIGAGMISDTYLEQLTRSPDVAVIIVGDRDTDCAAAQAAKHGVAASGDADAVLAHPDVELVVNLTIPAFHAAISSQAIAAGKHIWSEKPITTDRASAHGLLLQADQAGLLIGVAPDTVLGPGLQTARRAIAAGAIGTPVAAQTIIQYPGPDLFHPAPEFLFTTGAGPLYDVGPYYLTALAHLFGPAVRVAGVAAPARASRTIKVGDRAGTEFPVSVPTHVNAIIEYADGGAAQSLFSFESPLTRMGVVEITGTEATMIIPDPNLFTGDIKIARAATSLDELQAEPDWETIPTTGIDAGRGIGALDLARCVRTGGTPLASGQLAYHVLDTMIAIDESIQRRESVAVTSSIDPVPLLAVDWDPFEPTLEGLVAAR